MNLYDLNCLVVDDVELMRAATVNQLHGVVQILADDETMAPKHAAQLRLVPQTAKQVRERFFDKYTTSGKTGGSGIGTYSAQMLARAQQGQLSMETSDSLISTTLTVTVTVTVTLPRYSFAAVQPTD